MQEKKHVEIDYHFVWEQVKSPHLRIGHVFTKDQTANILTKAMPKHRFLILKSKLCLLPRLDLREDIEARQPVQKIQNGCPR